MAIKITVSDNGPLRLAGDPADFIICDAQGNAYGLAGRAAIGLCRCGHSANKPFCDGSHARQGFESVCEAKDLPPAKPRV